MLIDRYEQTERMTNALRKISEARTLLEKHLEHPEEWHGVIRRQVLASVVHYSTAIEGNILSRDQVESIIAGESIEVPEKDRVEAVNYLRAMRWAQTRSQDPEWRLSRESILTLHFMVGEGLGVDYEPLGQVRHHQNTVQDKATGVAIYYPPRPADAPALLSELVEWIQLRTDRGLDPYVVNALAHLNFVAIHPFSDGNGRVSRLLCSLLMMREGYKAQAFWSLEQYLGEHSVDYGQILARVLGPRWTPDQCIATPWIEWYLEAVATQADAAERRMRRSIAEFTVVYAGLDATQSRSVAQRGVIAVWLAVTGRQITRRQLARYSDVNNATLSRDLRKLVDAGLLASEGKGRGAKYVPGPRIRDWGDFGSLVEIALADGYAAVVREITGRLELRLFGA
jgi:Fic family protein